MVRTFVHIDILPEIASVEWFTLTNKDKYCGEVYLELTFWSNVRVTQLL